MHRIGHLCVGVCLVRSAIHLLRIQPDLQAAPVASGGVCGGQMGRQHRRRGAIEPAAIQNTQVLLYCRLMFLGRLSAAHRRSQSWFSRRVVNHTSQHFVTRWFRKGSLIWNQAGTKGWCYTHPTTATAGQGPQHRDSSRNNQKDPSVSHNIVL